MKTLRFFKIQGVFDSKFHYVYLLTDGVCFRVCYRYVSMKKFETRDFSDVRLAEHYFNSKVLFLLS